MSRSSRKKTKKIPTTNSTTSLKVKPRNGWALNGNIRIHYIDSNPGLISNLTPLVYIPGALNSAEGLLPEMEALTPRRCVSMSLRGRGRSDAPKTGYTFQDNVSDVEAVVEHLHLDSFCLMAWSLGVPHAIRYTTHHPDKIAGLILLDYAARYPRYSVEWANGVLADSSLRALAPEHAVRGLQEESKEIPLWDELEKIDVPVLIIAGGMQTDKDNPGGSLLSQEILDLYERYLRDVQISVFEGSGHNVSQPDFNRFVETLKSFLEILDNRVCE